MSLVQKFKRLIAFFRQVQIGHQTAVPVALQLNPGLVQLVEQILCVAAEGHIALAHLVLHKHEHIVQGHLVVAQAVYKFAVLAVVHRIGRIQQRGHLIVHVGQLGELAGRKRIGQHIAVHGFLVGQAHSLGHIRQLFQFAQDFSLGIVIARGHHNGHHGAGAKRPLDFLMGNLTGALLGRGQIRICIAVGAFVGKHSGHRSHRHKYRRNDVAGFDRHLAHHRNFRHQILMLGLVNPTAEQHQQAGHQGKHRQQAENNGLDQNHGHVNTNAEMHEAQRRQARNGGQRTGGNFRNGLAQGRHAGIPHILGLVLIRKAMAQNDGVVNGQRQLQNHRHRIGNKRNCAENKVGALVQQGRRAEGEHQHRHLRVGAGGQHQHDDDGGDGQNRPHLRGQIGGRIHAHRSIHIQIVVGKHILDLMQCVDADVIHLFAVKGHGVQSRCILIVIGGAVKLHRIHAIHRLNLIHQCFGLGVGDV